MAGQYVSVALQIPRTTRPPGRYVSIRLGPRIGPTITLAPTSLPAGQRGTAYAVTITASGGAAPYSFAVTSGTLPAGLALDPAGTISGTPTAAGTASITVTASDSTPAGLGGPWVGVRAYTITIIEPPWRGLIASIGARWTRQLVQCRPLSSGWDQVAPHSAALAAAWQRSASLDRMLSGRWAQTPALESAIGSPWTERDALRRELLGAWREYVAIHAATSAPWTMRQAQAVDLGANFLSPPRQSDSWGAPWGELPALALALDGDWLTPGQLRRDLLLPWEQGYQAPWRITPPDEETPPPPPPPPRDPRHLSLRFACPRRAEQARYLSIPFGPWQCYIGRPRSGVIYVTNSVTVVRIPDNAPIQCSGVNLRADISSAVWSASLRVSDAASLDLLRPGPSGAPRQIRITINGWAWELMIESFAEESRFGGIDRTAEGRSRAAILSRDYAPARTRVQTSARTGQQLADEELAGLGFTVDWQGPDWLVPGGAWSYAQLAPLDALRAIAEAVGCVLQSDRTADIVRVVPAFRARPWQWSTTAPDVDIVDDYVLRRSVGSAQGVRHNAVEVRGETGSGIRGEVKITGTDGELGLPQVSHPLITAAAAAEARGIYELASVGPIGRVAIDLPLFPPESAPGLIEPAMLPRLSGDTLARVLSTQIGAQWTDGGGLYVRQSLELERHYDA